MLATARLRNIARCVYLILITWVLSATLVRSAFQRRAAFVCEVAAPIERWLVGVLNVTHLAAYSVLVLAGYWVFRERPYAKSAALVLALSVAVELEQAVFTVGHCRIRDLLPNLLAVALAGCGYLAIDRATRISP
jgi:hypothetical protein